MKGLWVLVDLDWLLRLTAAGFVFVAVGARVVAAETRNQIFASGASAAAPDASPEAEQSSGAFPPPVSGDCWAAGQAELSPATRTPGGPTP